MPEILLIALLTGLLYLTFLRPWLGVLALAVVGLLQPQGYTAGFAAHWPVYKILVLALLLSLAVSREIRAPGFLKARLRLFADWRVLSMGLLWLLFLNSTVQSLLPTYAWPKFLEIGKVLVTSLFALLLLDTRRKVEWFLFTLALSISLVAFKGGYWALMSGSVDRVYGPPGSQYHDNNHFAVLAVMGLPLLVLLFRRIVSGPLRLVVVLVIAVSLVAVLTSWSRGAMLSLGVTVTLLALFADRRLALVPLSVVGVVLAFDLLPQDWFARMGSIAGYEQDGSAQGRLEVWREGIGYALRHPLSGAGPDGWRWMASRDWHSAYVEVLAEHGFPALVVWLTLLLGTLVVLARRAVKGGGLEADSCAAVLLSLIAYAVGAAFLGLAYWDIYYQLLVAAVLLTQPGGPATAAERGAGDPVPRVHAG